jgi:hypothetical protein
MGKNAVEGLPIADLVENLTLMGYLYEWLQCTVPTAFGS